MLSALRGFAIFKFYRLGTTRNRINCICITDVQEIIEVQACFQRSLKAHADETRFPNATRFFDFQKQVKSSTERNFARFVNCTPNSLNCSIPSEDWKKMEKG